MRTAYGVQSGDDSRRVGFRGATALGAGGEFHGVAILGMGLIGSTDIGA